MQQITTGSNNAAFGNGSLMYVATGTANAAFGVNALQNCSGKYNTALLIVVLEKIKRKFNTILGA